MRNNIIINNVTTYLLPLIFGLHPKIDLYHNQFISDECLINATNDITAVHFWLSQYASKNTTFLVYKKEADRFLLWCTYVAGKNINSLKIEDFISYINFLGNPPSEFCCSVSAMRNPNTWRPFLGPLSDSAKNTSMRVLSSLMNYLVAACYLKNNPLKLIKQRSKFDLDTQDQQYAVWSKILNHEEWQALQQTLQDMPEKNVFEKYNKLRTQFLFACLYFLGLRVSEFKNSRWNAFRLHEGSWWFFVRGKGDKLGHIPVHHELLNILQNYRSFLGKSNLPNENDKSYLIVSKKTNNQLSVKQIYSLIKHIGIQTANKFPSGHLSREKLLKFSPHSLRHLSASMQNKSGIPLNIIKENLRHSAVSTTQLYVHTDDAIRHAGTQHLLGLDIDNIKPYTIVKNLVLQIVVDKYYGISMIESFTNFLLMVNNKILSEFQAEKNIRKSIDEFEKASVFRSAYKINYIINHSQVSDLSFSLLIEQIKREAEIRLINASVKILEQHI